MKKDKISTILILIESLIIFRRKKIFFFILICAPNLIFCQFEGITYNENDDSNQIFEDSECKVYFDYIEIHQINLLTDSAFEFSSFPLISCFSWSEYQGIYTIQNDTIIFKDKYTLVQPNMEFTSKTDHEIKSFLFNFKYDNKQPLEGRELQFTLRYNSTWTREDTSITYSIDSSHCVELPFEDIDNFDELTGFTISLNPNTSWIFSSYYHLNDYRNEKDNHSSNMIDIIFISKPKEEEVIRITKGLINENEINILSSSTKSIFEDYSDLLKFRKVYTKE